MWEIWTNYLSILFLLIALYYTGRKEGWRERERQVFQDLDASADEYRKCQKKWHTSGFWQRLFMALALVVQVLPDWHQFLMWVFVALWFVWVGYDGWTNMPKDLTAVIHTKDKIRWYQKFFYSGSAATGTQSKIDLMMGEYLPFLKLFYTPITIIAVIIYLSLTL